MGRTQDFLTPVRNVLPVGTSIPARAEDYKNMLQRVLEGFEKELRE